MTWVEKVGNDQNVYVGVQYACDTPRICSLLVWLHFYSLKYAVTHIWLYIWTHSSRNASYRPALPGLVFIARPWVKSLLLLTNPCKSVSLSHTHAFLLLFHGKALVFLLSFWLLLQACLLLWWLYSVCSHLWRPLCVNSEVCECVNLPFSARLIVRFYP